MDLGSKSTQSGYIQIPISSLNGCVTLAKLLHLSVFWSRKLVSSLPLPLALSRGSQLGVGSTRGPFGLLPGGTQQCPRLGSR